MAFAFGAAFFPDSGLAFGAALGLALAPAFAPAFRPAFAAAPSGAFFPLT